MADGAVLFGASLMVVISLAALVSGVLAPSGGGLLDLRAIEPMPENLRVRVCALAGRLGLDVPEGDLYLADSGVAAGVYFHSAAGVYVGEVAFENAENGGVEVYVTEYDLNHAVVVNRALAADPAAFDVVVAHELAHANTPGWVYWLADAVAPLCLALLAVLVTLFVIVGGNKHIAALLLVAVGSVVLANLVCSPYSPGEAPHEAWAGYGQAQINGDYTFFATMVLSLALGVCGPAVCAVVSVYVFRARRRDGVIKLRLVEPE